MVKKCKTEWFYLVRIGQYYYCRENEIPVDSSDSATRFLHEEDAIHVAEVFNGSVEVRAFTPAALRTITYVYNHGQNCKPGEKVLQILQSLYSDMILTGLKVNTNMGLTLGGEGADVNQILFQAVGWYADVFITACKMMDCYYNYMASHIFCEYEPLEDGTGAQEVDAIEEVANLYEQQIFDLALIWHSVKNYLEKAHRAWSKSYLADFEGHLRYFSNSIVNRYESDPEKYFNMYLRPSSYPS